MVPCIGLDVGFLLPVVDGSGVGTPVGLLMIGNSVVGASLGDWLDGCLCGCSDVNVGVLLGDNVAVTLGAVTGASVGRDDVGKLVEGDAVVGLVVASVG